MRGRVQRAWRRAGVCTVAFCMLAPPGAQAATWIEERSAGAVTATLQTEYSETWEDLVIADAVSLAIVRDDGGPSASFSGTDFGPAGPAGAYLAVPGAVRLRDLNVDGDPEVLVGLYTGGTDCCFVTYVATRAEPGAYTLLSRPWGGYPGKLLDVDGDGEEEFAGFDWRFARAFGGYDAAILPPRTWNLRDGRLVVTTGENRRHALRWMRREWRQVRAARPRPDRLVPAYAAYLATATSVGPRAYAGALGRARRTFAGTAGGRRLDRILSRLRAWGYLPPA